MNVHALAALARRLNREAGRPDLPSLFFLTDPDRTPDPEAIAMSLPPGTAIIYRHFGTSDRARVARRLGGISRSRRLFLLISADAKLAAEVGAAGVHWPEARLPPLRDRRFGIATVAAHSRQAMSRAEAWGADACILGPVLRTNSTSGNAPLGLFRASQIARASAIPVIALGGIGAHNATQLIGRGFAGIAAVDAFRA